MTPGAKKPARGKVPDPYAVALAGRIFQAFKEYNAKAPRGLELSQDQLGLRVAQVMGLSDAPKQGTVSRWMSATNPAKPDNPTLEAIAEVLDVDKTWLAFGARSG